MDFPTPAVVTEIAPTAPELTYDPYATIVYNADPQPYYNVKPEVIDASKVTSAIRNDRIRGEQIVKMNGRVNDVREYLITYYEEIGEEYADKIAELLEIDLSTELEVEIAVSIKATISVPVGTTAYDLSTYDFDVELTCNERDYEIQDYDADVESIVER